MSTKEMIRIVASAFILVLVYEGQLVWNLGLMNGVNEDLRNVTGSLTSIVAIAIPIVMLRGIVSSRLFEQQLETIAHYLREGVGVASLGQLVLGGVAGFFIKNPTSLDMDRTMLLFFGGATALTCYSFVSLLQWMEFHKHARSDHTTMGVRWAYSTVILVLMLADVILITKAADQTIFAMATIASAAACTYGVFFYQEKIRWNHPDEVHRFFLVLVGAQGMFQVAFAMTNVIVFPEQPLAPPGIVIVLGSFLTATMSLIAWNTRLSPGWWDRNKYPAGGGMENG